MKKVEKIKNAIIIHGPGRSGTTLLSNILSLHEDLGWISGYVNKYPRLTFLSYLNRLQGIPAFERWNRNKRKFPRPSEAYRFWLYYVPEFDNPSIEVINETSKNISIRAITRVLKGAGKKRFVTKITGMSRFQTIDSLFESPTVIWIDRDPKAVIMSYYKLRWGYKRKLALFNSTSKMKLIEEYALLYKKFQEDSEHLSKFRIVKVAYEDLVRDKYSTFKSICEFANLPYSNKFQAILESWKIEAGNNEAYKSYLSPEEEDYLTKLINE